MLLQLAWAAVAHGAENLTLEVRVSNDAAIGLYRRFRFVPAGVRKNYYAEVKRGRPDHVGQRHPDRGVRRAVGLIAAATRRITGAGARLVADACRRRRRRGAP